MTKDEQLASKAKAWDESKDGAKPTPGHGGWKDAPEAVPTTGLMVTVQKPYDGLTDEEYEERKKLKPRCFVLEYCGKPQSEWSEEDRILYARFIELTHKGLVSMGARVLLPGVK